MYWGKGKQRSKSILLRIKGPLKILKIRKEDIDGIKRAFYSKSSKDIITI